MLKRDADFISPARVFGFAWSIVFGLANLKLSRLQLDWTLSDWGYVLMGPISFLLGLFVIHMMYVGSRMQSINEIRQTLRNQKIDDSRLFNLIITAFVAYLIGYIVISIVKGPVPLFAPNPSAARTSFFIFGFGLLPHTMPVIVFFSIVYHLLARDNLFRKRILKAIVFITILTYLFLLQRYQLIMASVTMFTLIYYVTRYLRFRTVMSFVTVGIIIIYSISTLRAGKIIQLALYKDSLMKFDHKYAIFTEPYMYLVMNVENFVHSVSKLDHHTFGYYTFNFTLALTGLKHWIEEYFGIVDTPYVFSGYNTYTLFWTFYRDFGVLGISFVPLALGLVVGSVYHAMRRNPTVGLVSFYSIIVFVMGLSFFINLLGYLWFIYIIAWMIIILRLVRVRNVNPLDRSYAHL